MISTVGVYTSNQTDSLLSFSHSLAIAPPFPGLRRFPQGRRFKQWTGDDSKGLMKVCYSFVGICVMDVTNA